MTDESFTRRALDLARVAHRSVFRRDLSDVSEVSFDDTRGHRAYTKGVEFWVGRDYPAKAQILSSAEHDRFSAAGGEERRIFRLDCPFYLDARNSWFVRELSIMYEGIAVLQDSYGHRVSFRPDTMMSPRDGRQFCVGVRVFGTTERTAVDLILVARSIDRMLRSRSSVYRLEDC